MSSLVGLRAAWQTGSYAFRVGMLIPAALGLGFLAGFLLGRLQ